jgi:hypothetical protein
MNPLKDPTDLSGMFGESITVRKINGSVVIKNRPKRKIVADRTPLQLVRQQKMTEASRWSSKQMAKADVKALYAGRITAKKKSAYHVAVGDYMISPTVQDIDTDLYTGAIGDTISVKAVDDFIVTQVLLTITDASGKILERGQATQDEEKEFLWTYTATVTNAALSGTNVSVIAFDRPGNKGLLGKTL